MGIEPTQSAWKAGALPLSYTRIFYSTQLNLKKLTKKAGLIRFVGGGRRIWTFVRIRGQIYSLLPLTARPPLRFKAHSKIDHLHAKRKQLIIFFSIISDFDAISKQTKSKSFGW